MRISKLKLFMAKVGEAECIPKGYGLAYWDYARAEGIFYLIPFNLIARLFLKLYWTIANGFYPNWFERKLLEEYKRGCDRGYERGFEEGIGKGYTKRQKEVDNFFEAYFAVPIGERSKWLDEQEANRARGLK